MTIANYKQALIWIDDAEEISIVDGKLVKLGFLNSIAIKYFPSCQANHTRKLVSFLENQSWHKEANAPLIALSNSIITRCDSGYSTARKIVKSFERRLVSKGVKSTYLNQNNQSDFNKWKHNGLPEKIFQKYPHFYDYLVSTGLLSQLKISRDSVEERDGEPCLLLEGRWAKLSTLRENFEAVDSPQYGEKFYVQKKTRKVYTYLDNGRGLEAHHPYVDDLRPISKLKEADFQSTLKKAKSFVREGDLHLSSSKLEAERQKRTFIIQIVSSYVAGKNTNAHNLLSRSKHPYFHFISGQDDPSKKMKKGDVFSIGFGFWNQVPALPFNSTQGQFRSPDIWDYKGSQETVITNIAVTPKEAESFFHYTQKYQRDEVNLGKKIGFHLAKQNCSVYVKNALENINISVPTEISLTNLIALIAPDCIKNTCRAFSNVCYLMKFNFSKILSFVPRTIRKTFIEVVLKIKNWVTKLFDGIISIIFVPLRVTIGEAQGEGGTAFSRPGKEEKAIAPPLLDRKNWFRLSSYKFHLPGILQNWQREQTSTVIYKNPIKLIEVFL